MTNLIAPQVASVSDTRVASNVLARMIQESIWADGRLGSGWANPSGISQAIILNCST